MYGATEAEQAELETAAVKDEEDEMRTHTRTIDDKPDGVEQQEVVSAKP